MNQNNGGATATTETGDTSGRIPHALMQEMRITPELPAYHDIVHSVFLQLIDGKLTTPEEARAFLEPYSPPAPPPQVTIKRPRVKRGVETKQKGEAFDEESEDHLDEDEDLDDIGGEDDVLDLEMALPKIDLDSDLTVGADSEADEDEDEEGEERPKSTSKQVTAKGQPKPPSQPKASKPIALTPAKPKHKKTDKPQPVSKPKTQLKPAKPTASSAGSKPKHEAIKAAKASVKKPVPKAKPVAIKAKSKPLAKTKSKVVAKAPVKAKAHTPKPVPTRKKPVSVPSQKRAKPVKTATKKTVSKPAKKR